MEHINTHRIAEKKKILDGSRPLPSALIRNLDEWFRIELTYTSNAIEGNTLTRRETALVVEKGITVGGKSLVEHLEAINHASALDWVKDKVTSNPSKLAEEDILCMHKMILKGIDDDNAGYYRDVPVRIAGSSVILPNFRKVPDLMSEFIDWLKVSVDLNPVLLAAEAHYRLVSIHPFTDGNGRTARLLMNMLLMMFGYPPAIIRKRDRLGYIGSLEKAQLGGSKDDYFKTISKSVDRSLDIYLKAAKGEDLSYSTGHRLLKIGELAKEAGESNSTIRHWAKEKLLEVAEVTKSGYQLYSTDMIERIKLIQSLKAERLTLEEIREKVVNT